MARWQSGHAADCKSAYLGSTPGRASKLAQMVKSVDTRDLKSLGCKAVRVQVPLWAPYKTQLNINELALEDSHPSGGFFVS